MPLNKRQKKRMMELTEKAHNNIDFETLLREGLNQKEAAEALELWEISLE